jgi:hypothetical protein
MSIVFDLSERILPFQTHAAEFDNNFDKVVWIDGEEESAKGRVCGDHLAEHAPRPWTCVASMSKCIE